MPVFAGGIGEKNAILNSANDLHRERAHLQRNFDQQGRARGVACEIHFEFDAGGRSRHRADEHIGLLRLARDSDHRRSHIIEARRMKRSEDNRLQWRHSALAEFAPRKKQKCERVFHAGGGFENTLAAAAGRSQLEKETANWNRLSAAINLVVGEA